jgi:acetamidase/formamidase
MADHQLRATAQTVHLGGFSSELPPVLTVDSGDRITVETFTGLGFCDRAPAAFAPPELQAIARDLPPERRIAAGPHLLTGPIAVRGANPGDVLEVRLEAISPRLPVGFNIIRPKLSPLPDRFTREETSLRFIDLDLDRQVAEFPPGSGIEVPLRPFFGILGVATADPARNSIPPGPYGGNLDNRHLQAGARVFLPVFLPGAMFSIGDGHSAQGDGEVNVTAIETAMNGTFTLTVRRDLQLAQPLAETPTHWIVMGFGATLDAAFTQALTEAIAFVETHTGIDREEAFVLCSLAIDFHITQVVNLPQKGVHALIPKAILPRAIAL